jgi:CBS domain-containing protein
MKLKKIMTDDVKMVSADATLKELAREMQGFNVGLFPVCEGDQLIGAITDRDIMVRAVAEARDPATTKVREIMTQNVFYAFEDQDEKEAALVMKEKQVHRLMVFDRQWRLTGMVSRDDLKVESGSPKRTGKNKSIHSSARTTRHV